MVQAETEQRKSDAVALKKHVDADFDGHYQKIQTKVRHWRADGRVRAGAWFAVEGAHRRAIGIVTGGRCVRPNGGAQVDQRLVESAKLAVEGALEGLLENQRAALRDFEATLADSVKQSEEHAKQVEAALAKKLMASHKMVEVSMQKDAEARERLDNSLRSDILSQVRVISGEFHAELSRKADQPVLDALASEMERCAAELSRCAPASEVRAWLESKVDAVHVQSSLRTATTALQSKLDAKLKAEGEAVRTKLELRSKRFAGFTHALHDLQQQLRRGTPVPAAPHVARHGHLSRQADSGRAHARHQLAKTTHDVVAAHAPNSAIIAAFLILLLLLLIDVRLEHPAKAHTLLRTAAPSGIQRFRVSRGGERR
jgi:hypothetical protein